MKPTLAQGFFILFNVAAIPLVALGLYEPLQVIAATRAGDSPIPVDNGIHYLILMSVLWVLFGLQIAGLKGKTNIVRRWGSKVLLGWLLACVLIATLTSIGLHTHLTRAGYQACPDPSEQSRLSVGNSLIYHKRSCPA